MRTTAPQPHRRLWQPAWVFFCMQKGVGFSKTGWENETLAKLIMWHFIVKFLSFPIRTWNKWRFPWKIPDMKQESCYSRINPTPLHLLPVSFILFTPASWIQTAMGGPISLEKWWTAKKTTGSSSKLYKYTEQTARWLTNMRNSLAINVSWLKELIVDSRCQKSKGFGQTKVFHRTTKKQKHNSCYIMKYI